MNYPKISVVIPSKNGIHHLQECLPTVVRAARRYGGEIEIIVVDDHSADATLAQGNTLFPEVTFLSNPSQGACSARNFGVAHSRGEWLCFLDNDVFTEEEFFNTAAKYLLPDHFCVACAGYAAYPKVPGAWEQLDGVKLLQWKKGFPRFTGNVYNKDLPERPSYPSWGVQGAYFFCQRSRFEQLGGFDELLEPYLLEETDLAYRGLKRGWKIVYAPDTKPRHKCGGTIQSKKSKYTKFLSKRNRVWFVWKNVQDSSLRFSHFARLLTMFSPKLWRTCFKKYKQIRRQNEAEKAFRSKTDQELLEESARFVQQLRSLAWHQSQLDAKLGVDYLQERLNRYRTKYHSIRQVAWHMAWASLLALKKGAQKSGKMPGTLRAALRLEGGMGDLILNLNWAAAFYEKFCRPIGIKVDLCFRNVPMLQTFSPGFENRLISEREYVQGDYDLKITCMRCPIVQYARLERLPAGLLGYVEKLLDFEKENQELISLIPYKDVLTQNIFSSSLKRWHQPDILDELKLTENFVLPTAVQAAGAVLDKWGLQEKKYITVNREVGYAGLSNSTKLWPLKHYIDLLKNIKMNFPQYQIVGIGSGRSGNMKNADLKLAGKTTLEEAKVLLKYAALHIDSEGGLVHLRHVLRGGPSCVFFGPTSPEVYGYSENINLHSKACPICCEFYNKKWQENCMLNNPICMKSITPQQAFDAIEKSGVLN